MSLKTPVLFLVFNRPESTYRVFTQIKKVKPDRLFLAADGPRPDRENEEFLCGKTRELVLDNIDWDCEVKTLLRDTNLGCGAAVSQAITWFFNEVEEGIILEDDTVPDESFFPYCEELLIKHRENKNIMSVSGSNLLDSKYDIKSSYLYSKYAGLWGWASWRRAWKNYDFEIKAWDKKEVKISLKDFIGESESPSYFDIAFDAVRNRTLDTWDYQWMFHRWLNSGLGIIPSVNLVTNIGFDEYATHTFSKPDSIIGLKTQSLKFPLKSPTQIICNEEYDRVLYETFFLRKSRKKSFLHRIMKKLFS